jgi:hypothetical protein
MAVEDVAVRRAKGEAALHEQVARAHDSRAAAARRIGAISDAEEATALAVAARDRARRALETVHDADAA